MKTRENSKAFALSSALLTLVTGQVYANPEAAMDYHQRTGKVRVTTNTVLNTVVVKCPKTGNLVATATAQFNGGGTFTYYLKKNKELALEHLYTPENVVVAMAQPIQRIDRCKEGETVTYRFQANDTNSAGFDAIKPRLVVEFSKDRI